MQLIVQKHNFVLIYVKEISEELISNLSKILLHLSYMVADLKRPLWLDLGFKVKKKMHIL